MVHHPATGRADLVGSKGQQGSAYHSGGAHPRLDDWSVRFVADTVIAARRLFDANRDEMLHRLSQDLEGFARDLSRRGPPAHMQQADDFAPYMKGHGVHGAGFGGVDGRPPPPVTEELIMVPAGSAAPFCGDGVQGGKSGDSLHDPVDEGDLHGRLSLGEDVGFDGSRKPLTGPDGQKSKGRSSRAQRLQAMQGNKKKPEKEKAVFADASAMKERIRASVTKREYNVHDFYWDTGVPQRIARSPIFDNMTLGVIGFNALWIAIDTDLNTSPDLLDADPVFQAAEHFFCSYFFLEWFIRYLSFKKKRDGFRDFWFCFDTALCSMMVAETWVMTAILALSGFSLSGFGNAGVLKLIRLLRLTRMARMAKVLRAVPELIIMIKGIMIASRSVFFTLCLLVLIMYFFAIVFRQLGGDTPLAEVYFTTVPGTMFSLLMYGILPDMADIVFDSCNESVILGVVVLFFILLASLTVMNMLVGVLCEVVSVVSAVEKEQLNVNYVSARLFTMFTEFGDENNDEMISKNEFDHLMLKPEAAKIIQEIGVDVIGLVDYAAYIFKEDTALTFPDFMELLLQLRGSNSSTVKDIVDLRRYVLLSIADLSKTTTALFKEVHKKLDKVTSQQASYGRPPRRYDGGWDEGVGGGGVIEEITLSSKVAPSAICDGIAAPRQKQPRYPNNAPAATIDGVGAPMDRQVSPNSPARDGPRGGSGSPSPTPAAMTLPGGMLPGGMQLQFQDGVAAPNQPQPSQSLRTWSRPGTATSRTGTTSRPASALPRVGNSLTNVQGQQQQQQSQNQQPTLPFFPKKMWDNDLRDEDDAVGVPFEPRRLF
eukprot:TRINITY_DN8507_c1_g1_i1.p1 TRINITY_DN8507_c1_g1~~TRINITY_DN8507_c1_g1_i1.p1  ORF type:complete len:843 (-),score=160.21 TRINITY_DN8507_c1_g1_i1:200-2668(-)